MEALACCSAARLYRHAATAVHEVVPQSPSNLIGQLHWVRQAEVFFFHGELSLVQVPQGGQRGQPPSNVWRLVCAAKPLGYDNFRTNNP